MTIDRWGENGAPFERSVDCWEVFSCCCNDEVSQPTMEKVFSWHENYGSMNDIRHSVGVLSEPGNSHSQLSTCNYFVFHFKSFPHLIRQGKSRENDVKLISSSSCGAATAHKCNRRFGFRCCSKCKCKSHLLIRVSRRVLIHIFYIYLCLSHGLLVKRIDNFCATFLLHVLVEKVRYVSKWKRTKNAIQKVFWCLSTDAIDAPEFPHLENLSVLWGMTAMGSEKFE